MTKFHLLSDLHLEFDTDKGTDFFYNLAGHVALDNPDALILAGDIASTWPLLERSLNMFLSLYPKVFFVAGNHDVYGRTWSKLQTQLNDFIHDFAGPSNLTCFDNGECTWEDRNITFYGSTGWVNPLGQNYLDYDLGAMKEPLQWMPEESAKFKQFLRSRENREGEKRILLTHFIPHSIGIAPRWKGINNWYFHNPVDNYVMDLDLDVCCFGHTHDPCDKTYSPNSNYRETRYLCNPRGYPNEKPHLNYKPLMFEI